jgi:tetratricopeptide (TPR) repeat protein
MKLPKKAGVIVLPLCLLLLSCGESDNQSPTGNESSAGPNAGSVVQPMGRIESLESALRADPDNFALLSQLGDAYFEAMQYTNAITSYDKAIMVNPKSADCLNDRGLSYFYVGNAEAALESFDRAIAADPTYPNSWLSKGFVLSTLGEYDEALIALDKVREIDFGGPLTQEANKFRDMIEADRTKLEVPQ